MSFKRNNIPFSAPASQRGVVLIAGLLMVVLLTIIAVAAIRGSGLQESMAFNMRDGTVAFQAGESSLRSCESRLSPIALPTVNCVENGGVCNDLNLTPANSINNNPDFWLSRARDVAVDLQLPSIPDVAEQPKCLIEVIPTNVIQCNLVRINARQMGMVTPPNCFNSYRVTAQGVGAESTTKVILQSTYSN